MEQVWRFPFFDLAWSGPLEALSLLAPPLAELCCRPATEAGSAGAGRALFRCAAVLEAPPVPVERGQAAFPQEPDRIRTVGSLFWIGAGPALARVDPALGRATLWLGDPGAFAALPHWRSRRLLSDLLLALLSKEPGFALHAALLSREGEGVLISAPRGSGKTTFALGLVEEGWTLHTDDYALARQAGSAVLVSGLRRIVHLAPDTMERFSALLAGRLGLRNITGDKEGVELAGGEAVLGEVPVRSILFLERGAAQASAWTPLLTRDALPQLLGQVLALESGVLAQARFQTLAALARSARLARIEAGRALLERRGEAGRILAELDGRQVP